MNTKQANLVTLCVVALQAGCASPAGVGTWDATLAITDGTGTAPDDFLSPLDVVLVVEDDCSIELTFGNRGIIAGPATCTGTAVQGSYDNLDHLEVGGDAEVSVAVDLALRDDGLDDFVTGTLGVAFSGDGADAWSLVYSGEAAIQRTAD